MLKSAKIAGAACFAVDGEEIQGLERVNYIFGANGSGKTTISRALADPRAYAGTVLRPEGVAASRIAKVYNPDYVDATFSQIDDLPGVFLLGEGSRELNDRMKEIEKPGGLVEKEKEKESRANDNLGEVENESSLLRTSLANEAWVRKQAFPASLQPAFKGYNNSREKLLDRVLELASSFVGPELNLDSLLADSDSIFNESAQEIPLIPPIPLIDVSGLPGSSSLGGSLKGGEGAALGGLIDKLQNIDWVNRGRGYLAASDGQCPFCQQSTPQLLVEELNAFFDDDFEKGVASIREFRENYLAACERVSGVLDSLARGGHAFVDAEQFQSDWREFQAVMAESVARLDEKAASPSVAVQLPDVSAIIARANERAAEINARIGGHNQKVRNRKRLEGRLIEQCWQHFVRSTMGDLVSTYLSAAATLEKKRVGLEKAQGEAEKRRKLLELELDELNRQVSSSRRAIDEMNELLESVGFSSFRFAPSPSRKDGYVIQRHDGKLVADSLSEGERTFVGFLYYYHQLLARPEAGEPADVLAVIDDPISSLDSDVLFVVSSLVRRVEAAVTRVGGEEGAPGLPGRVRQLVVLTHNVHFHREVTYRRAGDSQDQVAYFVVKKRANGVSTVDRHEKNPITTAYGALWNEVRQCATDGTYSGVGLENIMRRILETYFRVLGGVRDDEIVGGFAGQDRLVCQSLFSWVNAGSHSILEELYYRPSDATTQTFLRVFERIFAESGHQGHYDMMMKAGREVGE